MTANADWWCDDESKYTLLHPLLICYAQMLINPGQLVHNGAKIFIKLHYYILEYICNLQSQGLSSFRDSDFWMHVSCELV